MFLCKLDEPVKYIHKRGAVIWVKLDRAVQNKILKQIKSA